MQSVKWLTFCVSDAICKTIVHFFPSAGVVTAPYPAECKLTLFGKDLETKSVVLDGARFGQPDGVRIEDAFPILRQERDSLAGLEIEISSSQPRVNLESSSCIIELAYKGSSSKFFPSRMDQNESPQFKQQNQHGTGIAIKDAFTSSSLVTVNFSDAILKPNICGLKEDGSSFEVQAERLVPFTVDESVLEGPFYKDVSFTECSWGLVRSRSIYLPEKKLVDSASASTQAKLDQSNLAYYLMYRDSKTRRPVSVVAI